MKKIATALFLLVLSMSAGAQKFDWNVNFDYIFSNYEYSRSHDAFDRSYTLHAARLTPEAGVLVMQGSNVQHRVRAGVDVFRQMGEGLALPELFGEILLYYDVDAAFRGGRRFEALAGCFSRRFSEADYIGPFFDDDVYFLDNNIEGMLFKYRSRRFYTEISLDWPGMLGDSRQPERRERFQVLSAGRWNFAGDVSFCWTGSFYHYACSPLRPNVVDNHMLYPRLEWAPGTFLDVLSVDLGGIFTYQCDRAAGIHPLFPMGLMSRQKIGKWKVRLDNRFYFGDDLMPLYDTVYGGETYSSGLYFGDLGFHTRQTHPSWADYLDLVYEPRIADWASLRVALSFRFGEPSVALDTPFYRGWQQTVALRINLDALRRAPKAKASKRTPSNNNRHFFL